MEPMVPMELVAPVARRAAVDTAPSRRPLEPDLKPVGEAKGEGYLNQGNLMVGCSPIHSQHVGKSNQGKVEGQLRGHSGGQGEGDGSIYGHPQAMVPHETLYWKLICMRWKIT